MESDSGAFETLSFSNYLDPVQFVSDNQDLLVSLPICTGIPFHLLEPILLKCEYKRLQSKEVLLSPGQPNSYLYVLLSGSLTVHIESLESEKGFQVLPGEFVGEVSIIDNLAPTAYVSAAEESLILCIHDKVLWSSFFQIQGVARNIFRQVAGRMRARNIAIQKSLEQSLRLEHLEKELGIAQEIQASMLPQQPFFPNHPQVEVEALMKSAKEIGGDLFDAFPLDAQRICVAIGDVAGKGVPAALFMVRSITLLRTEMMKTKDLLKTIKAMNATLSRDNHQCMFVTLMICVLDVSNNQLQYVNGGHNRPLFGNFNNGFQYIKQPEGILVGINPRAVYEISTRYIEPGDVLILYTDGVTEANNSAQEEFSDPRLLNFINQQEEQTAGSIVSKIRDAVYEFADGAEQSDDVTLLVLRYLGHKYNI